MLDDDILPDKPEPTRRIRSDYRRLHLLAVAMVALGVFVAMWVCVGILTWLGMSPILATVLTTAACGAGWFAAGRLTR